jgi:hypothetical protein
MGAIDDIAAECLRQVESEGWSPEHDDQHTDGSLARAAACYAVHAGNHQDLALLVGLPAYRDIRPFGWPWAQEWWKPKDPRRDLVRAGALIVAEIERMDRELLKAGQDGRAAFERACAIVNEGKSK